MFKGELLEGVESRCARKSYLDKSIKIFNQKGLAQVVEVVIQAILLFIPLQTVVVGRDNADGTMKTIFILSRFRCPDHTNGAKAI